MASPIRFYVLWTLWITACLAFEAGVSWLLYELIP